MKNKIILGSANFDQSYGIKKNFIKKTQINKILNFAKKNKIKIIDTSPTYNKSEKIIGLKNNNRFRIISKIPKTPKNIKKKDIHKWLKKSILTSLKNLKIKKFECLLLHDPNVLLGKNGEEIYNNLKKIKSNGFTKKIGISIYDFNKLNKILKNFKLDLIQAPFNIFDRRLTESGWLKKLKKRKIEVHARSIFLQGILLLKYNQLPKNLKRFKNIWEKWEIWLKSNKLNSLQACITFVFQENQIDGVVVGYNNKSQLYQILKLQGQKNSFQLAKLRIKSKKLIDPRKWIN